MFCRSLLGLEFYGVRRSLHLFCATHIQQCATSVFPSIFWLFNLSLSGYILCQFYPQFSRDLVGKRELFVA